ncbi:IS4 family transposase [Psychrobacillus soli]|uniref:IS4 family transposase n=1 Tax=Psychrobacillus soli TaxID=1543965 RepID=A0A544TMC9_9BACI|nr:IS4 family transposase [Psychrobacillus soli]TQR18560.1 IS4 family transposase [Psychrobacillus soli]
MTNYGLLHLKKCFELLSSSKMNELARETGFIQRERQIKVSNFLPFLFRNHQKMISDTLQELCLDLQLHHIPMTKAGLNKRFNNHCIDFLQAVWGELFQLQFREILAKMPINKKFPFKRFRILDGTAFKLPITYELIFKGTSGAGVKIQVEFDYLSGQFLWLTSEDGKAADIHAGFERLAHLEPKDLCVQDLGYYHLDLFEEIERRDAYFLSRARLDTQFFLEVANPPRHPDGRYVEKHRYIQVHMREEIQDLERGCSKEWPIMYIGHHKKMAMRCVIYRHTEKQEAEHKKRMARKHQKKARQTPKEHVLELAGVTVYLTNLPASVSAKEIGHLYSLRWQIELLFKTWKSHLKVHQIKQVKPERWLCHFYTQCIVLLLSVLGMATLRKMIWMKSKKQLSEDLTIRLLSKNISRLSKASGKSLQTWRSIWKDFIPIIEANQMKTTKANHWTLFS